VEYFDIIIITAIGMIAAIIIKAIKDRVKNYKKSLRGKVGEKLILEQLEMMPDTLVFKNLYLPLNMQKRTYTEIDIVAINKAGIYVIESKNFNGEIHGSRDAENWIQSLGGKDYEFYNPILQNNLHCMVLGYRIPKYEKYIKPVVVFGDNADIRGVYNGHGKYRVINTSDLYDIMMEELEMCKQKLSKQDIKEIKYVVEKYTNVSREVKRKHKERIKKKYK